MTLWDWAVAAYRRPGVAQACLTLQDDHGQNVPLLLAAAWAAAEGRRLDIGPAVALTEGWEADVVSLLRAIRRSLKTAHAGVDDPPRLALRTRIKAVELEAERVLLDALQAMAGPPGPAAAAAAPALSEAASAWAAAREIQPPGSSEIKHLAALICYDGPA